MTSKERRNKKWNLKYFEAAAQPGGHGNALDYLFFESMVRYLLSVVLIWDKLLYFIMI